MKRTTMTTLTEITHANHLHDLGITISTGEVPVTKMDAVIVDVMTELNALLQSVHNRHGIEINAWVSYDGRRDCSLPHPR